MRNWIVFRDPSGWSSCWLTRSRPMASQGDSIVSAQGWSNIFILSSLFSWQSHETCQDSMRPFRKSGLKHLCEESWLKGRNSLTSSLKTSKQLWTLREMFVHSFIITLKYRTHSLFKDKSVEIIYCLSSHIKQLNKRTKKKRLTGSLLYLKGTVYVNFNLQGDQMCCQI